jgi:hypothetical protein
MAPSDTPESSPIDFGKWAMSVAGVGNLAELLRLGFGHLSFNSYKIATFSDSQRRKPRLKNWVAKPTPGRTSIAGLPIVGSPQTVHRERRRAVSNQFQTHRTSHIYHVVIGARWRVSHRLYECRTRYSEEYSPKKERITVAYVARVGWHSSNGDVFVSQIANDCKSATESQLPQNL